MDEIMLKASSNKVKVFTLRENPGLRIEPGNNEFKHITLALCVNAGGDSTKPLPILLVQNLPSDCVDVVGYFNGAYQSNGWWQR